MSRSYCLIYSQQKTDKRYEVVFDICLQNKVKFFISMYISSVMLYNMQTTQVQNICLQRVTVVKNDERSPFRSRYWKYRLINFLAIPLFPPPTLILFFSFSLLLIIFVDFYHETVWLHPNNLVKKPSLNSEVNWTYKEYNFYGLFQVVSNFVSYYFYINFC